MGPPRRSSRPSHPEAPPVSNRKRARRPQRPSLLTFALVTDFAVLGLLAAASRLVLGLGSMQGLSVLAFGFLLDMACWDMGAKALRLRIGLAILGIFWILWSFTGLLPADLELFPRASRVLEDLAGPKSRWDPDYGDRAAWTLARSVLLVGLQSLMIPACLAGLRARGRKPAWQEMAD